MDKEIPLPTHHMFKNLNGMVFGRLTVLRYNGRKGSNSMWLCRCDCNPEQGISKEKSIHSNALISGSTISCGCSKFGVRRVKNRVADYPEFWIWNAMIQRCTNPNNGAYINYGQRGITVCDRWLESFENFYEDMGSRKTQKHTIDRKDNNLGYFKDNCEWVTRKEQQNNRRNNHNLTHNGETKTLFQWSEIVGIKYNTIIGRLNLGWTVEEALTTPPQRRTKKNHNNEN